MTDYFTMMIYFVFDWKFEAHLSQMTANSKKEIH